MEMLVGVEILVVQILVEMLVVVVEAIIVVGVEVGSRCSVPDWRAVTAELSGHRYARL